MSLQLASSAFVEGYRLGRVRKPDGGVENLVAALGSLEILRLPFAIEGAAMAWELAGQGSGAATSSILLDATRTAWHPFVHLGVGCALARRGVPPPEDPTVLDGYGFQLTLAGGVSGLANRRLPPRSERGRGRALWFVNGGSARACARTIGRSYGEAADLDRRANRVGELWRGVGTACAFAGDPRGEATRLAGLAGPSRLEVRRGVDDALRLWRSLCGDPPARVRRVAEDVDGIPESA